MDFEKDDLEKESPAYKRTRQIKFIATLCLIGCIIVSVVVGITINAGLCGGVIHPERDMLLRFFNLHDGIDVKFAHAVNSKKLLNESLENPSIMILEADVLIDPSRNIPIMAHPPANSSDLTLKEFLTSTISYPKPKGVKLDFKQIEVVEPSLQILNECRKNHTGIAPPIMLNADILEGPEKPKNIPVDAEKFLNLCKKYDETSVISPGWTTTKAKNQSQPEGYSWKMVKDMYALVKDLKQPVTFPVRASLVAASKDQLLWLLKQNERFTLTVWYSKVDPLNVRDFMFLRDYPSKVYYDLPDDEIKLMKKKM